MRLFDNSAIKIDLFPGRKDKKNGKTKKAAASKPSRVPASGAQDAGQQVGKDVPKSTVKAAKSMQHMERPTYQRPNTSRSFNNYTTGGSLANHSASESDHEYDRPTTGYSEQSNTSRTYQQPWSSPTRTEYESIDAQEQQRPSWERSDKSTTSGTYDYRDSHATDSTRNNTSERPSGDQRRSRADLQDEWEADQKLRTNIPKGAPHSTGHALKHKRSKADMIRATENMARTLSRSPHRSPANRRQLGAVDEVRPGTSSSNGSSRLPHHVQNNSTHPQGLSQGSRTTTAESNGASKLSHSQPSNANTSPTSKFNKSQDMTSNESDQTGQQHQTGALSPTKVSGVAKKQGKAFHSTIRTSPPLSMEPNKTTWSPTSSVPRRPNHSRTRSGQNNRSTSNDRAQVAHSTEDSAPKQSFTAERSNMQSSAGTNTDLSHSNQHGANNADAPGSNSKHNDNRSSIDNKKSDHLSLAQRENLANSQYATQQPQAIVNRPNGTWASHDQSTSESSAYPHDSSDTGHDSSAGEGIYSGQSHSTYNQPAQQTTSYGIGSRSDYNNGSNTASNQGGRRKSSLHEISYMKNYSRPSANESNQSYGRTLDYSRPNTGDSSASSNSASNNMDSKNAQPRSLATQTKDFAAQASSGSSSGNKQQKKNNANSSTGRSKYVDAGNSTKSPFQGDFGSGKHDPRKAANTSSTNNNGGNKFSNSNAVQNNMNNDKSRTIKKKPSLTLNQNNHIAKDSSARNKDVQASGRAKVVCINNGGSTIVDTPVTADFTHEGRKHDSFERKDSGQSDSWDFGGNSTYSKKQHGGRDDQRYDTTAGDGGRRGSVIVGR